MEHFITKIYTFDATPDATPKRATWATHGIRLKRRLIEHPSTVALADASADARTIAPAIACGIGNNIGLRRPVG